MWIRADKADINESSFIRHLSGYSWSLTGWKLGEGESQGQEWGRGEWDVCSSASVLGSLRVRGLLQFFLLLLFLEGRGVLHPLHMYVFTLGVELELQLPTYTTATATQDLSQVCDLCHRYHSFRQHWILNPLSKARYWTRILMDTSQACNPLSCNGDSCSHSSTLMAKPQRGRALLVQSVLQIHVFCICRFNQGQMKIITIFC